jgi:hypothetical protein
MQGLPLSRPAFRVVQKSRPILSAGANDVDVIRRQQRSAKTGNQQRGGTVSGIRRVGFATGWNGLGDCAD